MTVFRTQERGNARREAARINAKPQQLVSSCVSIDISLFPSVLVVVTCLTPAGRAIYSRTDNWKRKVFYASGNHAKASFSFDWKSMDSWVSKNSYTKLSSLYSPIFWSPFPRFGYLGIGGVVGCRSTPNLLPLSRRRSKEKKEGKRENEGCVGPEKLVGANDRKEVLRAEIGRKRATGSNYEVSWSSHKKGLEKWRAFKLGGGKRRVVYAPSFEVPRFWGRADFRYLPPPPPASPPLS